MIILDGKKTANTLNERLKEKVLTFKNKPRLDIILVGNDPASLVYVKNKINTGSKIGFEVNLHQLDHQVSSTQLENLITQFNQDPQVHGILLQLPLPNHLDEKRLIDLIDPSKDVDGFHTLNQGNLFKKTYELQPATPKGIMMLLNEYNINVEGLNCVIIGRSQIVGLPIAKMLLDKNATVTIVHSKTKNIKEICQQADLLVVAIGKANFVDQEFVKPGAIIIDVGINRVDQKLVGDVNFDQVAPLAKFITPVPGGVGPMTICALGYNLVESYEKHLQK